MIQPAPLLSSRARLSYFVMAVLISAAHCQQAGARTTFTLELSELVQPQATSESRAANLIRKRDEVITSAFASELTSQTKELWKDGLWAAKQLGENTPHVQKGLARVLGEYSQLDDETLRSVLETAYALDPRVFRKEIAEIAEETTHPKLFAMAALYSVRAASDSNFQSVRTRRLAAMQAHFPEWKTNPILTMLNQDLRVGRFCRKRPMPGADDLTSPTVQRPPLLTFFSRQFAAGYPVVFSIHRRNRDYQGLAIVRDKDGRFIRTEFGNLFSVPHLARSLSNLPGYITNGNTPQGIFTIVGVDVTPSKTIGQTPFLETVLPVEAEPKKYFHNKELPATSWTVELYRDLLPSDPDENPTDSGEEEGSGWRNYFPMYEAWFAGLAGRYEMLSHGTTVDPEFYRSRPWYPNTPTIGCICAKEIWDPEQGKALLSDQLALVRAYLAAGGKDTGSSGNIRPGGDGALGFFVVLELDDADKPVVLDDVLMDLLAAERL